MRATTFILALVLAMPAFGITRPGSPATTDNDNSCDISLLPAATLLLPYFEVDFQSPASRAKTTLFSVQNTTNTPQIARVTLWTDWAFPALGFNIFLTGYDLQPINLYDLFGAGIIAPGSTKNTQPPGDRSLPNGSNDHFLPSAAAQCANDFGPLAPSLVADLRRMFTTGIAPSFCGGTAVGGVHANAAGYVTIDVVATCGSSSPASSDFYKELLFDNVLTGDYQILNQDPATGNYAGGNPLVHIRAVPEGGKAGEAQPTNLPFTFYDRFTASMPQRTFDRRQPLPSSFAARVIDGGTGAFNTELRIWREAFPSGCATYNRNSQLPYEVVRFDEHENSRLYGSGICIPELCGTRPGLPATSSPRTSGAYFPPGGFTNDVGGWIYINTGLIGTSDRHGSQAWIVTSMFAEGKYAVEEDALPLGNGCSLPPAPGGTIGPAPNHNE